MFVQNRPEAIIQNKTANESKREQKRPERGSRHTEPLTPWGSGTETEEIDGV